MDGTKKVSREDLEEPELLQEVETSFNYGFDFDIVDFEEEPISSDLSEDETANTSKEQKHTFQLFSNSIAKEIEINDDEDQGEEIIGNYFIDTSIRDKEWDEIALSRKRPTDYYISKFDDSKRMEFKECAITGDDIWLSSLEPPLKLQIDVQRDSKKIITNNITSSHIKQKNKRGLQSRLKFKVYQTKLKELKEAKRKLKPAVTIPSKKPFINSKQSKFKSSTPSTSSGKPKFRTES